MSTYFGDIFVNIVRNISSEGQMVT